MPNQYATDAANLLHEALLQQDYQTGTYAPALAERLPELHFLGDSLLQLDYQLRSQATWDDGRPVLAADVVFTLKLIYCPGLPNENARLQLGFIQDCRADPADPRHLILICQGQAPEYRWASGDFPVLPEITFDPAHTLRALSLADLRRAAVPSSAVAALVARYKQANVGRHPSRLPGCGPYQLADWQTNRVLRFERKHNWWADRLVAAPFVLQAHPQQLQFLIMPNAAAAALALGRHEIDVLPQVPALLFRQLQQSAATSQGLAFYTTTSYNVVTMGFNTQRPALQDKYTRQALGCLLDPAALAQATQQTPGLRTASILPPASPYYNDSLPLPAYNPGQATVLLRRAGWQQQADGHWYRASQPEPLALTLRYRSDDNTFSAVGLQFRQAAEQLGIEVTLRPTEASLLTQTLQAGDFDAYVKVVPGNPFVLNFSPLLHSQAIGAGNLTRFSNPVSNKLLVAIAAEGRPTTKRRLLRQYQRLLREEAPIIPLFVLPSRLAANRRLRHITPSGLKPGYAAAAITWAADTTAVAR
ncbi:MAG: ABC transporter substrate-binding protein [Janthinobacterium lividum]